jgi:arsenate reductase-like glutaredoxin family protein
MLDVPTLIKRPILNTGTQWLVGFSSDLYQTLV